MLRSAEGEREENLLCRFSFHDLLEKHDVVWMKRKRKINTKQIFEYLINGAIITLLRSIEGNAREIRNKNDFKLLNVYFL